MTPGDRQQKDVLIGGGGFAGLALGIALRQALGESFAVTIADPAFAHGHRADTRASAIAAAARRLFQAIGVWEQVADEAQPILDMVVTDSRLEDAVRPAFLSFAGEVAHDEPFAHMIENGPLMRALMDKAQETGVDLHASAVAEFDYARSASDPLPSPPSFTGREGVSHRINIRLNDGAAISARLLVGADGARSAIREQAGITTHGWDYGQSGIVTTVSHERDHHGRAEEHFLPAGPFAILPLKGRRSSLVWTEETREAERIIALNDEQFHAELERRFGLHLGEIRAEGPRRAFPLGLAVARSFIAERIALVGDAAHVIHPIAGQGLNMGLKDIAALAEAIADAARLGLDPGGAGVLEHYQRWRRFDTMAMGIATDGLNRLFSNRSEILRAVRDLGLGLVDRAPALKQLFIREAAGLVGDVPKLLRGEAL
ncbi:MAG TPA: ubiquinone biosynthesis hydroxylase [Xanthobacteraceae bacterium]|nr:ubiquinone biosynthesis hydroxylase [Xanthobacteraceae bacterium]